jgi:hypothetical protein
MVAFPAFTDPVIPGDVVGNDPLLPVIVVPVAPVTPVTPATDVGDATGGGAFPVGDASGGGPSVSRSCPPPPHAARRTSADVDAVMRFLRTGAPFERLTVTQRPATPTERDDP